MAIDEDRWLRLLFHLYDRNTEDDADLNRSERLTVLDFAAIHRRITSKRRQPMTLPDPARRGIRTFAQAFVGALVVSGVLSGAATSGVVDWAVLEKVIISAAFAGAAALVSYVQNMLEDHTATPALLKAPPSAGVNPMPDPPKKRTRKAPR